jgi:hypothetical protein
MATLMLDPNSFLREYKAAEPSDTIGPTPSVRRPSGNIHLSVGDVATAREFQRQPTRM